MDLFRNPTRIFDLSNLPRYCGGKPEIEKIAWFKDHVYYHKNSVIDADNISFALHEEPGEHLTVIDGTTVRSRSKSPRLGCAQHGQQITTLSTTRRDELLFRYRAGEIAIKDYPYPVCYFEYTPRFLSLLRELEEKLDFLAEPGIADQLDLLALALVAEARCPHQNILQIHQQVQEIYNRIMTRSGEDFNIDILIQQTNMSRAAFYREWKKCSVKSPYQLLLENRINTAKWMLKQTDLPVKLIAEQSGFRSGSVFTETFRKYTGRSPREYRGSGEL